MPRARNVSSARNIAEEPWRTLFRILTMEGLRAGEALGLQWQDLDLGLGRMTSSPRANLNG
jgi:integrase